MILTAQSLTKMILLMTRYTMKHHFLYGIVALFLASILVAIPQSEATAGCLNSPGVCSTNDATSKWWGDNPNFSENMERFILDDIYKDRIVSDWWTTKLQPALKNMTAQLTATQTQNSGMLGGVMDGISTNRSLLAMQTLQAGAYKNYTPNEGLCRFGTNVRSLAAADMGRTRTQLALATIGQARQLGTKGSSADSGPILDRSARITQFERLYCDPADNNGLLAPLCGATPKTTATRFNKDISVARTLFEPQTLNVNFVDGVVTADEEDILALASYLYGHDVPMRDPDINFSGANAAQKLKYLSQRQLVAFRNVAQNSFNMAVAARGTGGAATNTYMENILRELGLSPEEAATYLSNDTGTPSYHAQMEILTKKIYQNPNFYTNLIDKPANIDRQIAAIDAIGLMQDRDVYQSLERQEMLMSLLLEMKTRAAQRGVENNLKSTGLSR